VKHSKISFVLVLFAATLTLAGCNSTPKNQGSSGGRIDPSSDAPSEAGSLDLRSGDLIAATDRMAADIAQRLDVSNAKSPPVIVVGPMENATSSPHQNYDIFLDRLRAQLLSSGARHNLTFVRERATVEHLRDREYGGKDPSATAEAYKSTADYMLVGKVADMPTHGANYYFMSFQLVQLRDARSGPDLGSGVIVWENGYEVKFQ